MIQALAFIIYAINLIPIRDYFIFLNISFSIYIIIRILSLRKGKMFFLNPLVIASIFMFLFGYGFPFLIAFNKNPIRYFPSYENLSLAVFYANIGFESMWLAFFSKGTHSLKRLLRVFNKGFKNTIFVRKNLVYFICIIGIIINIKSINKGSFGVLATIFPENNELSSWGQMEHYLSLGLSGLSFLLAWQTFKLKKYKSLFYTIFIINFSFQLLSGYKGGIIISIFSILVAYYLATKRLPLIGLCIGICSVGIAYSIVNPYRAYLTLTKVQPKSIKEISECLVNGFIIQSQIIEDNEISIQEEFCARITFLPEMATFIDYKNRVGLKQPRDPDFNYFFWTTPLQLIIPRAVWSNKPVNDIGVWWVSNTVVGNLSNSSSAFGPLGFLYLTMGIFTIIIGFTIIGWLLKLCYYLIISKKDGAVLCGVVFLSSLYSLEAGFNVYFNSAIKMLIIAFIFQFFILNDDENKIFLKIKN